MHSTRRKECVVYGNDDVSNAYLPGMYHDWVFIAHHRIRHSLTRRNIQFLPGSLQQAPGFCLTGKPENNMKTKEINKMSNYKFETLQLHVGQEQPDPATDARAVPIYQTTSYVFRNSQHAADRFGLADAGNIYGRLTNSTQDVLEKRVAALEGGSAALAVASGAAAITYTIEALAASGGHIVAQKTIYGGSFNLLEHTLPQYGVETTFVDAHNLQEVEGAIKENTRAIYLETLGNPNSDIPDIDAIAAIAHKHGLPLVIDNTFGTPYWIRPIEHGADIVVHSATKVLGGHGTTLGGVIVESGNADLPLAY